MHTWDETTDLLAYSVFGYVVERVKRDKDPHWGAKPADELARSLDGAITPAGIGGHQALALFRDELLPACRPMEHPLNLAYVATAPSHAAVLFDLVVSASSIFGGLWECGAGAIAAENQTLHWLAELAGFPDEAAGCFVSGGSAANLSALVAARHVARERVDEPPARWCFATTRETHASVHAAARTMDVDVVSVEPDERGRMTGDALAAAIDEHRRWNPHDRLFAVVIATMLLPAPVLLIPQFLLFFQIGWYNTYLPLTIPTLAGNAFFIFLLRQYMRTIPRELDEAARMDGAGHWTIYRRIILPLSAPALTVVAVFTFLGVWNDFFGPLLYLSDGDLYTVPVALATQVSRVGTEWNKLMAANLIAVVPPLVLYFVAQKQLIGGIASVGLKG